EAATAAQLGIPAVLLFGLPEGKDPEGSHSHRADGVVPQAIAAIKREAPHTVVITDVCLCQYTDHGHCGLLDERGNLLNDETANVLARIALSHARAGADIVAPSAMIDGQVAAIRCGLDEAGLEGVSILSYAAKYASAFYGPFRDAADGAPQHGDRSTHQMDPANAREALKE